MKMRVRFYNLYPIFLLLFVWPCLVQPATVYYVSPNSTNESCENTSANKPCSLQAAIGQVCFVYAQNSYRTFPNLVDPAQLRHTDLPVGGELCPQSSCVLCIKCLSHTDFRP